MPPACNPPALLVLGASARGFAASAARAGITTDAADLFGDLDLVEVCRSCERVQRYPEGLVDAASRAAPGVWCYSGAIENRPDLIAAIAAERPLAGSAPDAVRRVRDPAWLARACQAAGLVMPHTALSPEGVPTDGTYLRKPLASAGGRGIHPWFAADGIAGGSVWQQRVEGEPWSAAFVAAGGVARLLFVTRQIVGWEPCRAGPFAWCGALEAVLPPHLERPLRRLGDGLAAEGGLCGLFGVDFLRTGNGAIVVLEVNPRPTASMELFERAGRGSLATIHLVACGRMPSQPSINGSEADAGPLAGKAVLHAWQDRIVTTADVACLLEFRTAWADEAGFPGLADIPVPGTRLRRSSPVVTVFASAFDAASLRAALAARLEEVERIFSRPCGGPPEPPARGRETP